MGKGFAILVWEGWGAGLVRIEPRLLSQGLDMYGNPQNWFAYNSDEEKAKFIETITADYSHWQIIET